MHVANSSPSIPKLKLDAPLVEKDQHLWIPQDCFFQRTQQSDHPARNWNVLRPTFNRQSAGVPAQDSFLICGKEGSLPLERFHYMNGFALNRPRLFVLLVSRHYPRTSTAIPDGELQPKRQFNDNQCRSDRGTASRIRRRIHACSVSVVLLRISIALLSPI